MFTRIKRFLAAPAFEDEDKTRIASLLNVILLTLVPLAVLYALASVAMYPNPTPAFAFTGTVVVMGLGARSLMRRGRVRLASVLLSSVLWVVTTIGVFVFGGVSGPIFSVYFIVTLIAGLLSDGHGGIALAGLSALTGLIALQIENSGGLPPSRVPLTPTSTWILLAALLALVAVLLNLATRSIREALERARHSAQALAESNRDLENSRATLKEHAQRLKRRSTHLEVSAEVGRVATTILDTDQLTRQVVELIHERFDLYYVGLFLVDESGEWAVLRAAAPPQPPPSERDALPHPPRRNGGGVRGGQGTGGTWATPASSATSSVGESPASRWTRGPPLRPSTAQPHPQSTRRWPCPCEHTAGSSVHWT